MSYVGIKSQDTSMPISSTPTATDYTGAQPSYSSSSTTSSYNQATSGMASGIHYMPPRDIQNRKAA